MLLNVENYICNTAVFKKPKSPQVILSLQLFSNNLNTVIPTEWIIGGGGATGPPFIYLFRVTPYTDEYLEIFSM